MTVAGQYISLLSHKEEYTKKKSIGIDSKTSLQQYKGWETSAQKKHLTYVSYAIRMIAMLRKICVVDVSSFIISLSSTAASV